MKYVTTIDLTSLSALRIFIRNVREVGGIPLISGVNSDLDLFFKKTNLESDIGIENIFRSENEVFASTTNALQKARASLDCEIGDKAQKSAACTQLDSVPTFKITNTSSF